MRESEKGFSLVELSIVLVIVGLLIGGVLVAQSMTSAAKVEAVSMEIGQFDAGVENFKTKFNYLPGDAPAFGGNGDGVIDAGTCTGSTDSIQVFSCEISDFWNNFDSQQFPAKHVANTGIQANISGAAKNVPESKLGSKGSYFIASALSNHGTYSANTTNPQNFYAILNGSQAQAPISGWYFFAPTNATNSAVKPSDLLALDKKIDDGIANSGNVLSGSIYNGGGSNGPIDANPATVGASTICSSGSTYLVGDPGYECTPIIRIGASVSDPQ